MKFILGVFVGAALMLGSAYVHDTGMVKAGPQQPFVNWDTTWPMNAGTAPPHILNTPNLVSGTGALSAAEKASANTRRVSDGAMMPSSQRRAVA
jgi:hypothetical protein